MSDEEIAAETEEPQEPPTPIPKKRAPRKKKEVQEVAAPIPVMEVDANFWGELLATSRAQDRAARTERLSNLVKFK